MNRWQRREQRDARYDREWELAMVLVALVLLACLCEMIGLWK